MPAASKPCLVSLFPAIAMVVHLSELVKSLNMGNSPTLDGAFIGLYVCSLRSVWRFGIKLKTA